MIVTPQLHQFIVPGDDQHFFALWELSYISIALPHELSNFNPIGSKGKSVEKPL